MAKILAKQRILCELSCSHFICKSNNINGTIFWVRQIFMERHLKEEFHVSIKTISTEAIWSRVILSSRFA